MRIISSPKLYNWLNGRVNDNEKQWSTENVFMCHTISQHQVVEYN